MWLKHLLHEALTETTSVQPIMSSYPKPFFILHPQGIDHNIYHTTWLTFTTGWILIEVGNLSLIALVKTTSSMIYGLIYLSTNFFTSLSLNTKSFIFNMIQSLIFHTSVFFLPLSTCLFISSYALTNAVPASSCTFLILFTNSIAFSIFPFLLRSTPILNSLS